MATKYNNVEIPVGLESKILEAVHAKQRQAAIARMIGHGIASVLSLAGIVTLIIYLGSAMNQSGVSQYVSIAFSDMSVMGTYWKELALSIVESLPVLDMTLLVGFVAVWLWSSAKVMRDTYLTHSNKHIWSSI